MEETNYVPQPSSLTRPLVLLQIGPVEDLDEELPLDLPLVVDDVLPAWNQH